MILSNEINVKVISRLLDQNESPVARIRLLSRGINPNNRVSNSDAVIADRGCLACGNCIDACPVVREKEGFIFSQNQRTSMALENIVTQECRRCYQCIKVCPQVSKEIKEYSNSFRTVEKMIHLSLSSAIVAMATTGIILFHTRSFLPEFEANILQYFHRIVGIVLFSLPFIYLLLDKNHLLRLFNQIFFWNKGDWDWVKMLLRHLTNNQKYPIPSTGEFTPTKKAWFLYILFIIYPILCLTGVIMLGYGHANEKFYQNLLVVHIVFAFITDILLFLHIYIKYLRKWGKSFFEMIKIFTREGHWSYPFLYDK